MTDSICITVLRSEDYEVMYIDGKQEASQHLNRLWPERVLQIIEGKHIKSSTTIDDSDIMDALKNGLIEDTAVTTNPQDPSEIWSYSEEIPEELYKQIDSRNRE